MAASAKTPTTLIEIEAPYGGGYMVYEGSKVANIATDSELRAYLHKRGLTESKAVQTLVELRLIRRPPRRATVAIPSLGIRRIS